MLWYFVFCLLFLVLNILCNFWQILDVVIGYCYYMFLLVFNFQVNCAYLFGEVWNVTGLTRGLIDEKSVECKSNHLSSFVMAVLDLPEVY